MLAEKNKEEVSR